MRQLRIGNDIQVKWAIFYEVEGEKYPYDLTGKDLTVEAQISRQNVKIGAVSTEGNILFVDFYGKDQRIVGLCTLTLVENKGKVGMHTTDACEVFELVPKSCMIRDDDCSDDIEIVTLEISSTFTAVQPMGVASAIDSELSETSTNAVQNKVITAALNDLKAELNNTINEAIASAITNMLNTSATKME